MKLLLASASQTRNAMLAAAGLRFRAEGAPVSEESGKAALRAEGLAPHAVAKELADLKALAFGAPEGTLVIGCDQILEHGAGEMLDKPASFAEAAAHLRLLSGRVHRLHSAVSVAEDGHVVWHHVESVAMHMRPLSPAFVHDYLVHEFETVRHSVGAYHLEGRGAQLFERVEGSHFAVLGLPLLPLLAFLRRRGALAS